MLASQYCHAEGIKNELGFQNNEIYEFYLYKNNMFGFTCVLACGPLGRILVSFSGFFHNNEDEELLFINETCGKFI